MCARRDAPATPKHRPRRWTASESAASRAAAISGKLLNFSRPDDSQVEALDLGALVASLRPLLRRTLKPQIQLQVDVAEGLWVDFDRQQLELILLNLVGNADEALSAGGLVELSAARQHGDAVQLPLSRRWPRHRRATAWPRLRGILHHQAGERRRR